MCYSGESGWFWNKYHLLEIRNPEIMVIAIDEQTRRVAGILIVIVMIDDVAGSLRDDDPFQKWA